ncbi:synergin gamma isoform X3 [Ascaphus truei]|uniref:synergin gamma isoform X3 n=1 Tax=Ascaphus truei TaxID=8439 RepID=UPI003F5922BA
MTLRPGAGGGGGGGGGSGGSFMFPVAGGIGPPQGMMPMQQHPQGFPMFSMMQPNMQNVMGIGYGAQIPQAAMAMQGGMPMGPMQAAGMPFMGQSSYLGIRGAAPQYTPDMQKQFAEEQQKRYEQQQKMLEEERKRRQFEEQKQKLRLLSSVKPKIGEKSRDDALEAIKGNLDGFSRDAKMHPAPVSHPKKTDFPTPPHSAVSVSQPSALLGADEEFSDFMQGPIQFPSSGAQAQSVAFQPFSASVPAGQRVSEQAETVTQPRPLQIQGSSVPHGTIEKVTALSTSATKYSAQKTGLHLEEKMLTSREFSAPESMCAKSKSPEGLADVRPHSPVTTASHVPPGLLTNNWGAVGGYLGGPITAAAQTMTEHKETVEESVGVGIFPTPDTIQPMLPSWIYNDSLVPELYKTILETTMTATGIDTSKLYPILMSSGLPRETLGQIWALANRTTPGKLTKEELYIVLAMMAITQRGGPSVSVDVLSQFASAPVPTLSGFPMNLPTSVNQLQMMSPGPAASRPLNVSQPAIAMNITSTAGGAVTQVSSTFMPSFPAHQLVRSEDDDFQDFQDASKSGPIDDSFSDFQSNTSTKTATSQIHSSAPPLLMPMSGTATAISNSADKYAVFKAIDVDKPSESTSTFADFGDKYHAFRELEKHPEHRSFGDGFADFKSGADDGFTDFKTADSISPLDPPAKETHFPAPFPTLPLQQKPPAQLKPSLNVADLALFSSVTTADCGSFPFSTTSSSSKSSSFPAPPLSSSSVPASAIPIKNSKLSDNFGDFSLFGTSANVSIGGQDDFADFMAFNSGNSSSEQIIEDKSKAIKQEPSTAAPPPSTTHVVQTTQPTYSGSHSKYDIFKQLSLESSGLVYDELKDAATPRVKNDDDFADFHADKFTIAEGNSEKSLVDKVAAFKQAKEDSASVKSLDLPSIGGSSVGKEDSEDALSIQFDMKLADVGGDLKHVMSDSSLDLATVSGQHPPAADVDDFKGMNDSNGSALSTLANYDWSEKEDTINQNKKQPNFFLNSECGFRSSTSIFQKKETSFGSSENITTNTISKVTTFSSEDGLQEANLPGFASFQDSIKGPAEEVNAGFSRLGLEDVSTSGLRQDAESKGKSFSCITAEEKNTDDFGEFQREKPKISKFDFLMATTQGKVKSSEEMIKSELATLDLCVQGSHKRSLSLGDKEITRPSPSPALDQPFRDRSNTLSEKPVLPVIRDKYKDLTGEVEESERYAYEWQRCLESALQVIKKANDTLNGISSSSVCTEVIQSAQGMEYLLGVVEVYRVTKRVELGIKATAVCSEKLQKLLKEIDKMWNNVIGFMSLAALTPDESALDFSSCMLRPGIKHAQELACGVCLLNVDSRSKKEEKPAVEHPRKAFNSETDNFKLSYGGHQYHASCANFWINCVEPKPPGLLLPDLL